MKKTLLTTLACLTVAGSAHAQGCNTTATSAPAIVEIVHFRLAPNVTDEQFLTAAQASVAYLCATDGFVRRSLSRDETGLWTDYVEWTDVTLAQSAAQAAMQREDMMPFMTSIDPETIAFSYSEILPLNE